MDSTQQAKALLPFYGMGVLNEEERRLVEAYLENNPEARLEAAEFEAVANLLPEAIDPVVPADSVKRGLMARVAADQQARRPQAVIQSDEQRGSMLDWLRRLFVPPVSPALVGLTAVLFLIAGGWALSLNRQATLLSSQLIESQGQVETLAQAVDSLSARNDVLEQQQEMQALVLARLSNPNTALVAVAATEAGGEASGRLLVSPAENELIFLSNRLDPLESGETYQFWLIDASGTPISGGLFAPDEAGFSELVVRSETAVSELTAVGVSIEPAGGSEQPTADQIILLSEL